MKAIAAAIAECHELAAIPDPDYIVRAAETESIVEKCRLAGLADPSEAVDALRKALTSIAVKPDTLTPPQVAKRYGVSRKRCGAGFRPGS